MRPGARGAAPPGPRGWPVLGNLPGFARDPLGFLDACARHGDISGFRIGRQQVLVLNGIEEIERVFVREHRDFPKNRHFWRQVSAVFGNGLMTSEGAYWQRQRRLAAPAFSTRRLAGYAGAMAEIGERACERWRAGEVRDLHPELMGLTFRIAARTLFGASVEADVAAMEAALDEVSEEIATRLARPFVIPDAVPLPGHLRYRRGLARIEGIVERVIAGRRARPEEADDLLSALMEARDETGASMSDRQLRDEVITFLLAGHETTALVLSWAIHLLGRHPGIEEDLAREAHAVLGDRRAGIEDVPRLRLAEGVVNESMRLYPPGWAIGREARLDCEIGGHAVRAGTSIYVCPWLLQRDPRFYDAPEAFRPSRWEDGLAQRLPRFAFMPFGGGPRICIGHRFAMIEAVLILATLVRRFRFVGLPERPAVPAPSITLRPGGGVWARIEARAA